jgi:hypothetical protein
MIMSKVRIMMKNDMVVRYAHSTSLYWYVFSPLSPVRTLVTIADLFFTVMESTIEALRFLRKPLQGRIGEGIPGIPSRN